MPSLYAETTTGRIFPRFYIRGLGSIDFYLGASQPVSIIQDDVVLEHVVLKSNPVYDVDQVEVLRGRRLAVRPQHHRRHRQVRHPEADPGLHRPRQLSYATYNSVSIDGGFGADQRHRLVPRVGAVPAPR